MAIIHNTHFDVHEYIKKAVSFGIKEDFAEFNARAIEQALDNNLAQMKKEVAEKDLVTNADLKKEVTNLELKIEQAKNQVILWVAGMFIASGFIQHFFK